MTASLDTAELNENVVMEWVPRNTSAMIPLIPMLLLTLIRLMIAFCFGRVQRKNSVRTIAELSPSQETRGEECCILCCLPLMK